MDLSIWLNNISTWYQDRKHDQGDTLKTIIFSAPDSVFGPELSDDQSKAIACWLDGCLRLFQQHRYLNPECAFKFLNYTSSQLERVACDHNTDLAIRDWCMKRLQHMTVLSLEFCNQQEDQQNWLTRAHCLIEGHVKLMEALAWNEPRKHDQVIWH
ncbi:transcriptional regulator [Vibrio vulnificus]|nr:transcriptional regulator [Vibrio vulnificus]EIZ4666859.1 transcriptional regulator [Vibrio vulnificus]